MTNYIHIQSHKVPTFVPAVRKRTKMMRLHGLGVTTAHNGGTGAVLGISACPVQRRSGRAHGVNDRSDFRTLVLIAFDIKLKSCDHVHWLYCLQKIGTTSIISSPPFLNEVVANGAFLLNIISTCGIMLSKKY